MPYQIPGRPGTFYEPGTRKGNATVVWRGVLPGGKWSEFVTDSTTATGAAAYVQRVFDRLHRDRTPDAGEAVTLETAARHYAAAKARSDVERAHADRLVRYLGAETPIGAINQAHVTKAANCYRAERAAANAQAERGIAAGKGGQVFPPPSAETINRNITTPLRAIVHFSAEQGWRSWIVLRAVKPQEGERPRPKPGAARDPDVTRLLAAIEAAVAACRPTAKGRDKEAKRRAASLRALFALVLLVHERGYRIGEWLRWDWESIDLPAASARMMISKPNRWVDFEMSPQAVVALSALEARDAGRVFPWHGRSAVYAAVDTVAPKGLKWRPHQSRRAVVTAIMRNTGDPSIARDYVGHASIKTTLRYNIVDASEVGPTVRTRSGRPK